MKECAPCDVTTVIFQGTEISLPLNVPFNYAADKLVLDFSLGFRGKLVLRRACSHEHKGAENSNLLIPHIKDIALACEVSTEQQIPGDCHTSCLQITPETRAKSPPQPQTSNGPLSSRGGVLQEVQNKPLTLASVDAETKIVAEKCERIATVKENVTPPLAAPGRKAHISTGKRTRNPDAPRLAKKGRATAAADSDWEFRWVLLQDSSQSISADTPPARWGASLAKTSSEQICLFGGSDDSGTRGDTWILDLHQGHWNACGDQPTQRCAWHALATASTPEGEQLLVFGGEREQVAEGSELPHSQLPEDEEDLLPHNAIALLDPSLAFWVPITLAGEEGNLLPARSGHTLTTLDDGRVLLFGGLDDTGKFRNDSFVLDARRMTWMSLTSSGIIKGAPPKARAYHTATLVGERIIVLGGMGPKRPWSLKEVYSLTPNGWHWKEHTSEVQGDVPTARSGHSAVALPGGRFLLLFGGGDSTDDIYLCSAHILDTLTWHWSQLNVQGHERPIGRLGHSMVLTQKDDHPVIVVHGGRAKEDTLLQDTWVLDMIPTMNPHEPDP